VSGSNVEVNIQSIDTLIAIAGVAIAIAGFSGVVMALPGQSAAKFGQLERSGAGARRQRDHAAHEWKPNRECSSSNR
jgi:hypothetical protein